MTHGITFRSDGSAEAAFACTPPWHGLGVVLDHPMSSAEALRAAQLDWDVATVRLLANIDGKSVRVKSNRAVIRTDNKAILGIARPNYRLVSNIEAFQFLDGLAEDGEMTYEAAFSLGGGRTVVLLARLPHIDYITDSDVCKRYILFSTTHDGTAAIHIGPTSIRVVCANTYLLALAAGGIASISHEHWDTFKHKLDIRAARRCRDKLHLLTELLDAVNRKFDVYVELARRLARHKWTSRKFRQFLDLVYPQLTPADLLYTERRALAVERTRQAISQLYYDHPWQIADTSVRHTAWAAFNSVLQYIDYLPRRAVTPLQKAEARFNASLYGSGRKVKQRALAAAVCVSGIGDSVSTRRNLLAQRPVTGSPLGRTFTRTVVEFLSGLAGLRRGAGTDRVSARKPPSRTDMRHRRKARLENLVADSLQQPLELESTLRGD